MAEQNPNNKRCCIGVLAHVDANRREPHKTSLIARLLAPQAAIKTGEA